MPIAAIESARSPMAEIAARAVSSVDCQILAASWLTQPG
jgi:hypothetical protein